LYLVPFRSYRSLLFKFGHFAFLSHHLMGLGAMYYVYLTLTGKRVVDLPLVLIELFGRCYG